MKVHRLDIKYQDYPMVQGFCRGNPARVNLQRRSIRKKKNQYSAATGVIYTTHATVLLLILLLLLLLSLKLLQRCACHPTSHKILKT